MQDFCFLEYHTEYSCEGSLIYQTSDAACFSFIFDNVKSDNFDIDYKVILYKGTKLSHKYNESNACLLTKQQIANHLKQAQSIYPFEFKITEIKEYPNFELDDVFDIFEVNIKVKHVCASFHKYLLTWLRYTYEYPYNVLLLDTYKLKKEKCFRFTSIANLFNIVVGCANIERSLHQIPIVNTINKSLKVKELKNRLNQIQKLNEIYYVISNKVKKLPTSVGKFTDEDLEFWENSEIYEKFRKPIYLQAYKNNK